MRADDDVDGAILEAVQGRRLLLRRDEPREQADLDRERRESLTERRVVLRREDRGRDEDRDLLAVLRRLEGGAQRDLGLAVADIADDEPVHRSLGLHVRLDLGGRAELVDGLLVREGRLHLGLPGRVVAEGVPARLGSCGVQRQQVVGEVADRLAHPVLGAQPFRAAQLGERRSLSAGVPRDPGDLFDRDEDPVAGRERQLEIVAVLVLATAAQHLFVAGDTVIDVDHKIARRQALEQVTRHDPSQRLGPADSDGAEQLAVGDEDQTIRPAGEAAVEAARDERDRGRRRRLGQPVRHGDRMTGFLEHVGEAWRLVAGEDDPSPVLLPGGDGVPEPPGPSERQDRLVPAERIAAAPDATGHRRVARWLGFPGQLERARRDQARFPVPWRQIRRGPVLGQVPRFDELAAALVGLAPQERGGLGDVARLVEDEQGPRWNVVQASGRRQLSGPHLGGVPDRHRTRLAGGRGGGPERIVGGTREAGEVGGQPLTELRGPAPEAGRDPGHAVGGEEELRCRQEYRSVDLAGGPLVGRVERPQRIDLVAEELDADRQLERWREDVDDATAPRELTAPRHLHDRHVAKVEQLAQQGVLVQSRTRAQLARRGRQVIGRDGVLEESLDAGDEDPRPAAPPGGQRRDTSGRLVGDELAPFVGEGRPRLERRDRARVAEPRAELLRDPVADLGVAGDPDQRLATGRRRGQRRGEVGLRPVRDGHQPGVPADPPDVPGTPQPLAQGRERPGRSEQGGQRRKVGQPMSGAGLRPCLGVALRSAAEAARGTRRPRRRFGILGLRLGASCVLDLGIDLGDVEVDRVVVLRRGVPGRELGGDLLGDAAVPAALAAERWPARVSHRRHRPCGPCASRSWCAGCRRRPAGRRPRRAPRAGRHRLRATGTC